MTLFKRGRLIYWIARELIDKYTKALSVGVIVGIVAMIGFRKFYPTIIATWFLPVERIGIVGEFTPSTLPLTIQNKISRGLTTIATDGSVLPGLAESWEATDSGKTYTFHLQKNAVWHNGQNVKAKDVNYNIRDVTFDVIDDYALKATLKDPYSPFPTLVAKPIFQRGLNGFGSYKVSNLRLKGDSIQFIRLVPTESKDNKPIEYRFYRTEAQAITAYKLGDIDAASDLSSPAELASWKHTDVTQIIKYDQIVAIFFNLKDQFLMEKSVRQALGYTLPEINEEHAYSPLSKNSWAYTDKIRRYTTNLSQAKKVLSQANIDVTNKEIVITTFSQYVDIAQLVAKSWQDLGLQVKVKVENVLPPDFQVVLSAQSVPPDPDQYPFWHSTQRGTNITSYSNVKIDKILEDARREIDQEKRKKLYGDFQRFLVEDAPAVFYYYPSRYTVRRT